MKMQACFGVALALAVAAPAVAQDRPGYVAGPVFTEFGAVTEVPAADFVIPEGMPLQVAFDVSQAAPVGQPSRTFNSAARFINMHAAAGIAPDDVRVAIVVHGRASVDVLSHEAWAARDWGEEDRGERNPTAELIAQLVDQGVRVIVCGQSATGMGITKEDLAPGVELALSAMTAHAVLQRQGYTLNPF
jgi:intracellular sulfur oxidation DsrE/DsrF family protein